MKLDQADLQELDTITLELDDGTEAEHGIIDEFSFEGHDYIMVAPLIGDELLEEATIYECEEIDGELNVYYIDDDAAYDRIVTAYNNSRDEMEPSGLS